MPCLYHLSIVLTFFLAPLNALVLQINNETTAFLNQTNAFVSDFEDRISYRWTDISRACPAASIQYVTIDAGDGRDIWNGLSNKFRMSFWCPAPINERLETETKADSDPLQWTEPRLNSRPEQPPKSTLWDWDERKAIGVITALDIVGRKLNLPTRTDWKLISLTKNTFSGLYYGRLQYWFSRGLHAGDKGVLAVNMDAETGEILSATSQSGRRMLGLEDGNVTFTAL